ncbi:MAG: alpha/beta hydrolase family protein [Anaerolineae bacterium]
MDTKLFSSKDKRSSKLIGFNLKSSTVVKLILLTVTTALLFSCSVLGIGGERQITTIGTAEETFVDQARDREIEALIWYPTQPVEGKEYGGNKVFYGFFADPGAEIAITEKAPLYVLVHGTTGTWRNLSWLAAELAENGAMVIAANHPGSTYFSNPTPAEILETWNQPQDVSFMLDSLLSSEYSQYIDEENIVVIGLSLGGYTSMALSGATLEMERMPEFCATYPDDGCRYFEDVFETFDAEYYAQTDQDFKDDRVKAAIAFAPGLVESMTADSLQSLETPILIIGAEDDKNVPPATHLTPMVDYLPEHSQYREIEEAAHFSFMQICKDGALEILEKEGEAFACEESGDKSRIDIHDEVIDLIEEFLADI